jgi:LPXTG-site transpeptidase (sortase) family protein
MKVVARATGNVLLGLAVGLLAYYGITDLESEIAQRALKTELVQLGPVGAPSPSVVETTTSGPVLDFTGWREQDRAFWSDAGTGDVIGRIVISRMDLDCAIVKGTDRQTLKSGPGWIVTTSVPGPTGNCAISGHRTTYLAPFRRLDRLKPGDVIEIYTPFRRYTYKVYRSLAVRPWQVEVIAPTEEPILTLTACHPPYSARYRLIVQSKLVEARPLEGAPTSAAAAEAKG